jgi:cytoskeletal protein RodZ
MLLIIVAVVIALVLFSMLRALAFPAILLFGGVYLWISITGPKTEHLNSNTTAVSTSETAKVAR